MFFAHWPSEIQTSLALQKKTNFQALKNFFFRTALMKLRQARLWNNIFSGSNIFFVRMPLVKSANSTLLPRLSPLQIVQMHAIHN